MAKNLQKPEIQSVLVVDGDKIVRLVMDKFLRREGCDLMTAPDGLAALDMLKTLFLFDLLRSRGYVILKFYIKVLIRNYDI